MTHILSPLEIVHIKHWSICVKILGSNLGRNHSGVPVSVGPLNVVRNPSVSSFTISFPASVFVTSALVCLFSNYRTWQIP